MGTFGGVELSLAVSLYAPHHPQSLHSFCEHMCEQLQSANHPLTYTENNIRYILQISIGIYIIVFIIMKEKFCSPNKISSLSV